MDDLTFGLNRRPFGSAKQLSDTVRREEALGFDYAWFPDSHLLRPDAFILAALTLQATERLRAGPLLANPITRHPVTLASAAATLGVIGPGRAAVGIGAGDTAVSTIGERQAKVGEVRATMQLVRRLLEGEAPDLGSRLPARRLGTRGKAEIWGAASGPRAAKAAGAAADVIVLRCGLHPANLNALADAAEAGAREAGRNPAALRFGAVVHTLLEDDADWAAAQARIVAAGFYELTAQSWQRPGFAWNGPPIQALAAQVYPDIVHAEDVPAAAALTAFVTPEVAGWFALAGDVAQVANGLRRVREGFPRLWHVIPQPLTWKRDFPDRVAAVMQKLRG
ncbi:MAG TPA: LLM class flavin-dependent oxidoreductase [Dehalococcoidia bacterium]|nr:LLM class flavin-dependent oxidoreductase [Dehalococcoidia bacterium]